jgi:multicomponent Na+:H+ antiporter subunit D
MIKIWNEAFWKPAPEVGHRKESPPTGKLTTRQLLLLLGPITLLALITVAIGLQPQLLFNVAEGAAAQLLDSKAYTQAVLAVSQASLPPIDIVQGVTP